VKRSRLVLPVGLAAVALALPAGAWAHATLGQTVPQAQARVELAPRAVTLRFDQAVRRIPRSLEVRTATGRVVSAAPTSLDRGRVIEAALPPGLRRGAYTVRWRLLSADGHVSSGVFTFGVGVAAPPPTEAYGASGPTWSDDAVRWAYFVFLALLVGGLGFRLLVVGAQAVPARFERRFYAVVGVGAVGVLESGLAAFVMRAEDALQLPFADLLYGDLSPLANETRFGAAFIATTLGFALVAALVFLAWLLDRRELLWPAFAVALGFASGVSLSGHSAVEPNSSWLSQFADWVHLCAAALWAGGLVMLALCVWPAAPALRRAAFVGFSRLAVGLVGALLLAGAYLSVLRLPRLSDLWTEAYGQVLLVKFALVAVSLAWGAAHHFVVRPRLERGGEFRGRSLVGESAVGMAVLLLAAVLVNSAPPPRVPDGGPATVTPAAAR
jgi:copper transport protein